MPGSGKAELYFIAAMMVLILVVSFASVLFFFRQYKKEMAAKAPDKQAKKGLLPVEQTDDLTGERSQDSKNDG